MSSSAHSPELPEDESPANDQANAPPAPHAVSKNTAHGLKHFVSTIKNAEQQVGEHIIQALQHADTVAVLTSVVVGPGGQQHIVSAALNPGQAAQVDALLKSAAEERIEEVMCLGFHCLVRPKPSPADQNKSETQGKNLKPET
ncbi:MAG: hypothetical protein KDA45_11575 [Planctomycetales bacterium]|nr:hypothetical protein [Planctomycetales bacterium]